MKTKMNVIESGKCLKDLSEADRNDVCRLYRDGEKVTEIQKAFGLKYSNTISIIVKKAGEPLRKPGQGRGKHNRPRPAQNLEQQLAEVDQQIAEAQARKAELELKRQAQQIRFEMADDTTVMIHGVTEHFHKLGGMAKLLQFIHHQIPQRGFCGYKEEV